MFATDCGTYKVSEERMGLDRLALELWVELNRKEPGVGRNFDDFHQSAVWTGAADLEPVALKRLSIVVVESSWH